ncbi:MAG TPA: SDR family oxidoreductase [Vicinamibacterales bacterium]|nr:SDR family oxidoreductase [Vicinamibacterales bacterium]
MSPARTAFITGGGRGLGADISRAFHAAGYRVAIASRTDDGLAGQLGARATFIGCDVRDAAPLGQAVQAAAAWGGGIGVLVNNAGKSAWRRLGDIDEAFWDDMLTTNLKSVLFASQAAVPHMAPGSAIVNISSLAGKRGSANNAAYCAAKFGVNGLTQALAKELGPSGIRVNAVCPVYLQTEGLLEALHDVESPAAGRDVQQYLHEFAQAQSALRVLPTGVQVAAACVFLASDAAGAITGQCVNVDCGVLPS